jgi:hypothetical protein
LSFAPEEFAIITSDQQIQTLLEKSFATRCISSLLGPQQKPYAFAEASPPSEQFIDIGRA